MAPPSLPSVCLKRTFSMLGKAEDVSLSPMDHPMTPADSSPVLMTPQATPDSPRRPKFSMSPPSPPCKRTNRAESRADALGPRVSWSDVFNTKEPESNWDRALRQLDSRPSRFMEEFTRVKLIGQGNFSVVYSAQHKIDGSVYAVKKTKGALQTCQSEAQVLASLSKGDLASMHIVRYYGCWIEESRLHLQTELCDCSLSQIAREKSKAVPSPPYFTTAEIVELMQHVGRGLDAMHSKNVVHLDIKPDNILRKDGVYKIADLGLATLAISSQCREVTEGDCRYLARELLKQELTDLPRADVFSFGAMIYELGTGKDLPHGGDEWHWLRDGIPPDAVPLLPSPLAQCVVQMLHPVPQSRPLCAQLLHTEMLASREEQLESKLAQSEARATKFQEEVLRLQQLQLVKERPWLGRHLSI
jgi:wee1-like protein kinase